MLRLGNLKNHQFQRANSIGKPFKSAQEVQQYLESPSWSVKALITSHDKNREITGATIKKMLKLSGLREDITPEEESDLISSLQTQMAFIKTLYDGSVTKKRESSNDVHFRLLKSDSQADNAITLSDLKRRIQELDKEVDEEKGEFEASDIRLNKSNDFFKIKMK